VRDNTILGVRRLTAPKHRPSVTKVSRGARSDRIGDRRRALALLAAADFLLLVDGLAVSVALPSIQRDLGFSQGSLQWVVNAYVLVFGGFVLLGGRAADLVGRRRVYVAGLLVFSVASVLAGASTSPWMMVAARAGQGLGGALSYASALALLTATFEEGPVRSRALGVWSAAGSAAIGVGALLGGFVTAALGWEWVFLLSAPAAAAIALLSPVTLSESRDERAERHFDVMGAATITAALCLLIYALVEARSVALVALAALLAGTFLLVERHSHAPLIPSGTFRSRHVVAGNAIGAILPAGLGASLFLGTLYLQNVLALDPLEAGAAYVPLSITTIVGGPIASRALQRFPARSVATAALGAQTLGLLLLAQMTPHSPYATSVLPGFLLVGLGASAAYVPVTALAMTKVGEKAGLASGLFNTSQQVGNGIAVAVFATVAADRTAALDALGHAAALTHGLAFAFWVGAAILGVWSIAAVVLIPRRA